MKLWFITGKGGVGKSTLSAATAQHLSRTEKVLNVSLDPAHNLGDIFGVRLNEKVHRFSRSLDLREVNIAKLTRRYLRGEMKVLTETYRYTGTINLDRYFPVLQYSPGVEEYALLTAIEEIVSADSGYGHIVFDTPPTGLTLRFLALPQLTTLWLSRLLGLRRHILKRRHTIGKIRNIPQKKAASGETQLAYDESDDPVLVRLLALEERYQNLAARLQGEDCSFCVVFNPDLLSLRESERLIRSLGELGLPLKMLIGNKVNPENQQLAEKVGLQLASVAPGAQLAWVSQVPPLAGGGTPLFELPPGLAAALNG